MLLLHESGHWGALYCHAPYEGLQIQLLLPRAGISQAGLAQMEAARSPRNTTRIRLAAALGLQVGQLAA